MAAEADIDDSIERKRFPVSLKNNVFSVICRKLRVIYAKLLATVTLLKLRANLYSIVAFFYFSKKSLNIKSNRTFPDLSIASGLVILE